MTHAIPPKIFTLPLESPCIIVPTRNPTSIMPCLHVPHHRATSRKTVLILTIHGMSQFQTTQVWETLTCIQFFCRTVLAPCGVLAIFRTVRVCGAALHGSDVKHGIFFLLSAKPAPSPTTNSVLPPVANTTGLSYTSFTACLDR